MSFKYYLYISDSKVDMLLPQIDSAFGTKGGSELGVDLKVLSAKRVTRPVADQRIARLERVVRYLQDYGDLGDVDEPGQFFWGMLPMRWGPFPNWEDPSLVFFGGHSERTVVGLGGSMQHVLGQPQDTAAHGVTRSPLGGLLDGLGGVGAASELEDEYVVDALDTDLDRADLAAFVRVREAVAALRGPAQNVEFVAKRLLHGQQVLLGSPVYAALVD